MRILKQLGSPEQYMVFTGYHQVVFEREVLSMDV